MISLNQIVVAVDLRDPASAEMATEVARQAFRLATPGLTQITFLYAIQVRETTQRKMLDETESRERRRYLQLREQLSQLAQSENQEGAEVSASVIFGKPWIALIQEVLRTKPDLVLAGPAHRGPVAEALFGSTTMTLIRKCPCPVWVTKPPEDDEVREILVAHDLSEVGSTGLEWGVDLMRRDGLHLHVLHCLEPEDYFGFMSSASSDELDREIASRTEQVVAELERLGVEDTARVSIKIGPPQVEIYNYLKKHSINLLIMGTLARSGISAVITGNTAETLLPWIRCSLLALKPDSFVSPVSISESVKE